MSSTSSPATSPTITNDPLPLSPPPDFSVDLEITEGGTLEPIHRQRMPVAAFNATDEPNGNRYIMMAYQAVIIGATREFHRLPTRSAMRITGHLPYPLPDHTVATHFRWAVEHAMSILQGANMWNLPLQEALQRFGHSDPRYSVGSTRTPSPPPLMLRPRQKSPNFPPPPSTPSYHVTTPPGNTPDLSPTSPTPDDPISSSDEAVDALITHDFEMALEEVEREQREMLRTPTPDGPQPGVKPGVGWIANQILPDWKLPNVPDGNGTSTAAFVLIDMTDDDGPSVLGTQGKNCPTSCRPLRAARARFPQRPYTRKQRFLFAEDEKHSPLVDAALEELEDPTLTAEVIRHRLFISKMRRTARHMSHLRRKFLAYQEEAWITYELLANANAAFRITHMINSDIGGGFGSGARLSHRVRLEGMDVLEDPWREEPTRAKHFAMVFVVNVGMSKTSAISLTETVITALHARFPSITLTSKRPAAPRGLVALPDSVSASLRSFRR
ncbi:hypothetical protein BGW80DRAFT_1462510 [Lactifluus volemus]|nr:hypothetical protein BGW80DRAFT_1462510 [Lactifluus volemus]